MKLIRFLFGTFVAAAVSYFYAAWARDESEAQIGKMQLSSYNTPGAESPVPAGVTAAGFSAFGALWWALRTILRMPGWQIVAAIVLGAATGIAFLFISSTDADA